MGSRRNSRETALQLLYLCDICSFKPFEAINVLKNGHECELDSFGQDLFEGTFSKMEYLDLLISSVADNWEMNRMATIDRNILRLATFEITSTVETPINVIINEAVEIAKTFSTADSSKFVNGILDKLKTTRPKLPTSKQWSQLIPTLLKK